MPTNILIFDSGVGGLSVLNEIKTQLPNLNIHYLMDNAAFPYGNKSDEFLIKRILLVCTTAVQTFKPDLLVIACNTASTLALNELREQLTIPIVGVVPAIKTAAALAPAGNIGLLATAATVSRAYTDKLIQDFAGTTQVSKFGSPLLVELAEHWLLHKQEPNLEALQAHLQQWVTSPPLTHVVLGCTHFPLLRPYLETIWPNVLWIDSGEAIARRVKQLLTEPTANSEPSVYLYWTDASSCPVGVADYLQQHYFLAQQSSLDLPCPSFN